MITIQKKLQKRIDTIAQLTGEYPKQIKITEKEYKELQQDLHTDNITEFRNCKLIINK